MPVAATSRGATPGLARDGGGRAPASNHPDEGRSRSPPHPTEPLPDSPVRWEAHTGTTSTLTPKQMPRSTQSAAADGTARSPSRESDAGVGSQGQRSPWPTMVRQHPWPKAPDQGSVQLDPGPGRPDLAADRQLHRRPSPRRRRQPDVQKLQGREERRRRNPALPPPSSPPARQPGAGSGGGRAVDARLTAAGELPSPGRHGQEKAGAAWNRLPGTPRRERRPPSWTPTGAMEGASDPAQRALDLKPERAAANQARSPRPEEEEGREGGREKRKGAMGWPFWAP